MAITVEGGRVMNLGNYETARIGVSITVPCSTATLDEAYNFGTTWVSEKIEEAVKAAKEG
jgi:gamma-glutamyltranspeptidase